MKTMKRVRKGFTLLELIIVLAIFSVIMVLVMSFIDPVSKIMKKSSTRERTASYVDNINEYLEKSLRYAQYVRVFEGDFCDNTKPNADHTYDSFVAGSLTSEEKAVQQFVDDYFDGAISSDYDSAAKIYKPLTGKVHVLKLCNDHTLGTDKPGTIYETIYDFTAGESLKYQMIEIDGTLGPVFYRWYDDDDTAKNKAYDNDESDDYIPTITSHFSHSVVSVNGTANTPVINPEHFGDYSYYYEIGDFSFNALTPSEVTDLALPDPKDGFYSKLTKISDGFDETNKWFQLCTVTYQNNKKGNNMTELTDLVTGDVTRVFLSPSYMNMTSSSLINTTLANNAKRTDYYAYSRVIGPDNPATSKIAGEFSYAAADTEKLQPLIKPVSIHQEGGAGFKHYVANLAPANQSENIYIIFVIPREVNSNIDVVEAATTTTAT